MAQYDQSKEPTHTVFSVVPREGKDDYWLNLGVVFPHKDGKGFTIFTNAWPHDGKLVCRVKTDKDDDDRAKETIREANDRRHGRR
jgi:hypothetical protein